MKKIITILFSLIMCLSLSGCSKNSIDEDAKKTYDTAMNHLNDLKSADMNVKFMMDMEDIVMKLEMKGSFNAEGKLQSSFLCTMAASGVKIEDFLQVYTKDDILYMNVMDQEKAKFSMVEALASSDNPFKDAKVSFDAEDNFKLMEMEKKNGKYYIHTEASDKTIKQASKLSEAYINEEEGIAIESITRADYDFIVASDNTFDQIKIIMNCTYKQDGKDEVIDSEISVTIDLKNKNKVETIKFPDLNGYEEKATDADSFINELDKTTAENI